MLSSVTYLRKTLLQLLAIVMLFTFSGQVFNHDLFNFEQNQEVVDFDLDDSEEDVEEEQQEEKITSDSKLGADYIAHHITMSFNICENHSLKDIDYSVDIPPPEVV